jgi:type I restriction enzyme R subunit
VRTRFTESEVEEAALEWLEELGWDGVAGPDVAPDAANPERTAYDEVVLGNRLRSALSRLNPHLPRTPSMTPFGG